MAISYERIIWQNHVVRRPRTYTSVENTDNSRSDTPAPGEIFQQGTPLNADNFNHMEDGIANCVDECNRLDEEKVEETLYTATIPASGWSGSSAPYTRSITVNGILATDTPIIDIVQSGTYFTDSQICDNWTLISRITTRNNGLDITADQIPSVAIPIQVRCLRHG